MLLVNERKGTTVYGIIGKYIFNEIEKHRIFKISPFYPLVRVLRTSKD